jgi:hypothetical protein
MRGNRTAFFRFMKQPDLKLTVHGKRWTIKRKSRVFVDGEACDGSCDFNKRIIEVRNALDGERELEVYIHELRHATGDFLDEDFVDKDSAIVAHCLHRLGYRKLTADQRTALEIE